MCLNMLTLQINIFIFFRFGIKLGWNKEVNLTPQFQKVKMYPHVPKSVPCYSLSHMYEYKEWWETFYWAT
jgi:hypothetical protein